MEIQTIFYTLASMFMVMGIVLVISIFFILWRLEKSVLAFKKKAVDNLTKVVDQKKLVGLLSVFGLGLKWFMERKNRKTT